MSYLQVSMIPAVRISTQAAVEARVFSKRAGELRIGVRRGNETVELTRLMMREGALVRLNLDLSRFVGKVDLCFSLENEQLLWPYEVVNSGQISSTLIDGCWVDICHWSEEEGRPFNEALKTLTAQDWREQIFAMAAVGIRGAVIQDVFHLDMYVGQHNLTIDNYSGLAFYPSALYPGRADIACEDPIEAILSAADKCAVQVAVGIGLFAWFDFGEQSLAWHKRVADEVWSRYGHHPSFYGFYVSEEIAGSLYFEDFHPFTRPEQWREVEFFFREFKAFCATLAPEKPILFACNNIGFERHPDAWHDILRHIDILLVFAFARDLDHLNMREIKRICQGAGCHFFVDMEVFAFPFDETGLVPKPIDDLVREIRLYDDCEQIYAYEYTGHMNHPSCPHDLGGEPAKALYTNYCTYAQSILDEKEA